VRWRADNSCASAIRLHATSPIAASQTLGGAGTGEIGGLRVIVAVAVFVVSAWLVAVTVNVW
jgi:hypothetical protein